jgi:Fe-S-cluster containining protein
MSDVVPPSQNLARAETVEDFDRVEREALRKFDGLNEALIEKTGTKLACGAGCSICCSLRVDVFAPEVFLVAHYIWTHFTATELAEVLERLSAHAARVAPLTPFEHATTNIRCPLLRANGYCGVYPARPHACRRHHSRDLAACQYTFDHPTDLETPAAHEPELYRALTEAMLLDAEEYERLGFDVTIYELGTALAEALSDPTCWTRWRNGEQAFLWASVTPAA